MLAAQFDKYGGPEAIEVRDVPEPTPKQGQVLVTVRAASLNPIDWKIRSGNLKGLQLEFPVTTGGDFSGEVISLGEGVTEFKTGDELFGRGDILNGGSGTLAELAAVNVANSTIKPKGLDFLDAASLPLVGVSALQAIEQHIGLKSGQKILIHGGAGGIGSAAIQIAKSLGAYVATTVSGDDVAFARELGADEVFDYRTERFEEKLHDFDAVFDTSGKQFEPSLTVLKQGGMYVTMTGFINEEKAKESGVTVLTQNTKSSSENLTRLRELVEKGVVKPQIDKVFSLQEARQAFEYLEQESPNGKVVVSIK